MEIMICVGLIRFSSQYPIRFILAFLHDMLDICRYVTSFTDCIRMVSQLTRERAVPSLQRYIKDNFAQTAKVSIKRYINTTKRNDQRKVSEIRKNWTFNFWISNFFLTELRFLSKFIGIY